ncbi:MAG: carboxypeptidase regulatory-like domain-containing protein [bacterium]|nr:carboxypeptidase regulatory-like domain-containing protein [bacterium]
MQTRDLLILAAVAAFAAGVGLVLIGGDSHATEALTPPGNEPAATAVQDGNPALSTDDGIAPTVATGETIHDPAAAAEAARRELTKDWDKGVIRGDIGLAIAVLDKIETITVMVTEMRNAIDQSGKFQRPKQYMVPVKRGVGTPTFEVRDIEFSDHPYIVSVYSPGLNGSRRTVMVTEETPLHDISLRITPGRPFSLLVRDQDRNPYPLVDVRMIPVGEPPNRRDYTGKTDGNGAVVFEGVLAGDYRLYAGEEGLALAEPVVVTVQDNARMYGNRIQGQGYTYEIQRGMPLDLMITDRGGYAVEGATVKLQATDRVKLTVLDQVTDLSGKLTFPHLTPGKWMITVTKPNHQPWTRQITITDGVHPDLVNARLTRLR